MFLQTLHSLMNHQIQHVTYCSAQVQQVIYQRRQEPILHSIQTQVILQRQVQPLIIQLLDLLSQSVNLESSESGINVVGVVTAMGNVVVVGGVTISPSGDIYATGITTFAKQIVGISTNNIVPFLFNNYSDLPSATTYHGQFFMFMLR